jgi:type II secretory pathway component PulC
VLPINERAADKAAVNKDPFTSGGTAALVLDGIIYNPKGTSIVIVRSADVSYVVSAGGNIGETGWTAASVTADTVTIEKDGKQEILSLAADTTAGLIKN